LPVPSLLASLPVMAAVSPAVVSPGPRSGPYLECCCR
jgi:hypothetical protein